MLPARRAALPARSAAPTGHLGLRPARRTAGAVHGYLRAAGPEVARERDQLTFAGAVRVHVDDPAADDGPATRPGLAALLGSVRRGDTVVVVALDRLGPSVARVVRLVSTLSDAGVTLLALREGVDTSGPTGRALVQAFAALADYDRRLAYAGPCPAGPRSGRPPLLSAAQVGWARARRDEGVAVGLLAAELGVGQSTLYRALSARG